MNFTYESYIGTINLLKSNLYKFADYNNYKEFDKCVILRHDVDYDIQKIIKIAELENENEVSSTYFLLLTSDFYNLMSKESEAVINRLKSLGHKIGLHFDEVRYDGIFKSDRERAEGEFDYVYISELIKKEANILSNIVGERVTAVSMHRPSKKTLESNLQIDGMVNSYGEEFFKKFKYISDSRMYWREDPEKVIRSREYNRIQLLTHAFWYFEEERKMQDIIYDFVYAEGDFAKHRYNVLNNNITNLKNILEFK